MIECSGCGKSFNPIALDGTRRQACPLCDAAVDGTGSVSKRDTSTIAQSAFTSGLSGEGTQPLATTEKQSSEKPNTVFVASEVTESVFGLWRDGKFLVVNTVHNQFPNRCLVSNTEVPVNAMRQRTFESNRPRGKLSFLDRRPRSFTSNVGLLQEYVPRYTGVLKATKWMSFAGPIMLLAIVRGLYARNAGINSGVAPLLGLAIMMTLMGFGALLASFVFKLEPIKVLTQRTVDGIEYYWIGGVHPELLETLPQWDLTKKWTLF